MGREYPDQENESAHCRPDRGNNEMVNYERCKVVLRQIRNDCPLDGFHRQLADDFLDAIGEGV